MKQNENKTERAHHCNNDNLATAAVEIIGVCN